MSEILAGLLASLLHAESVATTRNSTAMLASRIRIEDSPPERSFKWQEKIPLPLDQRLYKKC